MFLYHICPLHTSSGREKREADVNWSTVKPEKEAPFASQARHSGYMRDGLDEAGGLSVMI